MKQVDKMLRSELQRALDRCDAAYSRLIDELIAAGRGEERPVDTMRKDDDLSRRYRETAQRWQVLRAEKDRRLEYHGSLHRVIKD